MAYTTRKSLLMKVRNGDEISWTEFYRAYRPLILLRGKDLHLTDEENEELVQQVMLEIYKKDILSTYRTHGVGEELYFKYDAKKGRFRVFLRGIITRQGWNILKKRPKYSTTEEELINLEDENGTDVLWEEEWRRAVLNQALEELKNKIAPETFQIFENHVIHGQNVRDVAKFFDISAGNVYTIKCRCTEYLKEIVKTIEDR